MLICTQKEEKEHHQGKAPLRRQDSWRQRGTFSSPYLSARFLKVSRLLLLW